MRGPLICMVPSSLVRSTVTYIKADNFHCLGIWQQKWIALRTLRLLAPLLFPLPLFRDACYTQLPNLSAALDHCSLFADLQTGTEKGEEFESCRFRSES